MFSNMNIREARSADALHVPRRHWGDSRLVRGCHSAFKSKSQLVELLMAECTDKESFGMLTAGEEWFSP